MIKAICVFTNKTLFYENFIYPPPRAKKHLCWLALLLLTICNDSFAQVLKHISCDGVRVEWSGLAPYQEEEGAPVINVFTPKYLFLCDPDTTAFITSSFPPLNRFKYELQKQDVNGIFQPVANARTNATSHEFQNLADGIYRVYVYVNGSNFEDVYYEQSPCTTPPIGKKWEPTLDETHYSNEVMIGEPTVGFTLADANFNDIFCKSDITAAGGIFMLTDLSILGGGDLTTGETHYRIDICKERIEGGCTHWTSTYWQDGEVPDVVNLLTDVWQLHHEWTFWQGDYRVTLAIGQDSCVSYESLTQEFEVRDANCRQRKVDQTLQLTVFPNPANQKIHFDGLTPYSSDVPYRIVDVSGRQVSNGILPAFNSSINVNMLPSGMYVIMLEIEGALSSERFVVAR